MSFGSISSKHTAATVWCTRGYVVVDASGKLLLPTLSQSRALRYQAAHQQGQGPRIQIEDLVVVHAGDTYFLARCSDMHGEDAVSAGETAMAKLSRAEKRALGLIPGDAVDDGAFVVRVPVDYAASQTTPRTSLGYVEHVHDDDSCEVSWLKDNGTQKRFLFGDHVSTLIRVFPQNLTPEPGDFVQLRDPLPGLLADRVGVVAQVIETEGYRMADILGGQREDGSVVTSRIMYSELSVLYRPSGSNTEQEAEG